MTTFVTIDANGDGCGADPRKLSLSQLGEIGHEPRSLLRVIRDKCLECCCGQQAEVRRCTAPA